ncbi:hypothetical protein [Novosphingobium resinovorum]|uniref:hypothetical protein n=1 Tax=Novosphingobium resinovorum TaxID=158500 RepID=UPI002329D3E9|nr:hypothetical protein GCM10017612_21070 [Novosphingobium resinovorum]
MKKAPPERSGGAFAICQKLANTPVPATSTDYSRFAADEVDADIVNGPPLPGPVKAIPLGEEEVTVLCTPQMAASITCAADVMALPLINGDRNRVTWARWAQLAGVPAPKAYAMRFDRSLW